jgi:aspartate aminotransferase
MFNRQMIEVKQSVTVEFADYVRSMEAKGHKIAKLQTGDPDFSTFSPIIEKAYEKLKSGETHYTTSSGIPPLKEALISKLKIKNNLEVTNENLIVTQGAVHGLFITLQVLLNAEDEVICVEPCWMPYVSISKAFGAKVHLVSGDFPQMNEDVILENILNKINPKTKVIILNSPCNPSGKILSESFWIKLLTKIKGQDLYVISDEVYEDFLYNQNVHISPASLGICNDQVITLFSFSKSYAMTGWRIGYNVASKELIKLMIKSTQYTITCVSPFIQWAALEALVNPNVQKMMKDMAKTFIERRKFLADNLKNVVLPDGAFYALVDISKLNMDCFSASKYLVENFNVSLAPGLAFGPNMGKYLRLSFGVSDEMLREGILKLKEANI